MASAGGGRAVSRDDYADPEYVARMCALDWYTEQRAQARESLTTCRTAADFPGITRVNGQRITVEGPHAGAILSRVAHELDYAEAVLDNPEDALGHEWGEMAGEVALEVADRAIARAWRLLMAAARSTRNLRALMGIGRLMVRVAALRLRLTNRPARTVEDRDTRAHRERRAPLISLTQAAHAPPRGALALSPAITGGGPL
jgi:hypothetical protein